MQKRMARTTGLLYILVILLAGFSQGYVRGTLFIPDDAGGTSANILASESLFRLGLVTDLTAFILDLAISVLLYLLLKPTHRVIALLAAVFRMIAHPAIGALNLLNHYMVLEVLGGAGFAEAFSSEQLNALVMWLLEAHRNGYLIAGGFFGVHCALLGWLLYQSRSFPALLGVFLFFSAAGYLAETFGNFLFPGNEAPLALLVGISAAIGELSLTLFLLFRGVRPEVAEASS